MNQVTTAPGGAARSEVDELPWFAELWQGFRPYLIRLALDFLLFVSIWAVLLAAHWLTNTFRLGTKLAEFMVGFHETVVVLSFVWLSIVAFWDLATLKRRRQHGTIVER